MAPNGPLALQFHFIFQSITPVGAHQTFDTKKKINMKALLISAVLIAASPISGYSQEKVSDADIANNDVVAILLGKRISAKEKSHLRELVFATLRDKYAKDNKIEATEDEIKAFLDKQEDTAKQFQVESEQEKQRLDAELKLPSLSKEQRKEKQSQLALAEHRIKTDHENREAAKKMEKQLRPMLRSMAQQWIIPWKVNQSLYKKYGGRMIFQQGGVEPLDAYRDFLKDEVKKRNFEILNKSDEKAFWEYFTNEAMHRFYNKDEGEKFINTPWWLMDKPISE